MFFMSLPESILEMSPGKVCQLYVYVCVNGISIYAKNT